MDSENTSTPDKSSSSAASLPPTLPQTCNDAARGSTEIRREDHDGKGYENGAVAEQRGDEEIVPRSGSSDGGGDVIDKENVDADTSVQSQDVVSPQSTENASFVKQMINAEWLEALLGMGFGRIRAEKALFLTLGDKSVEAAVKWIEDHENDDDVDDPIVEVIQQTSKSTMSKEEAIKRAYELQKKLREERVEREKKEAVERERNRIASAKAMQEQAAKLEEQQRRRQLELLQKEKEEHEKERIRQRELLRAEYRERFGKEMPEEEDPDKNTQAKYQRLSTKEKVPYWINQMKKRYMTSDPEGFKKCISTLRIYCSNAKDYPTEKKYLRIKRDNAVFKNKVQPYEGAIELLDILGFKPHTDPTDGETDRKNECVLKLPRVTD